MTPDTRGTDDVADAEVFRGGVGADGCALEPVGLIVGRVRPGGEQVVVLEERIDAAEAEAEEDAAGKGCAALAGEQDIGAGGAFGIDERVVLFDDELSAQRDHEQDADPAAEQGEGKDARVLEVIAEEDERGQGEDDAGGDGLTGIAGGLHNVVLKDGSLAERAQHADGQHRDRNGSSDRQPRACMPTYTVTRAKDNAEDAAEAEMARKVNSGKGCFRQVRRA